jgi:K+-transporting ATPase KdpF subunit
MKSGNLIQASLLLAIPGTTASDPNPAANRASYIIGAVIALFILGYLIYSLLKPDKF